jgi:hypothetical protein
VVPRVRRGPPLDPHRVRVEPEPARAGAIVIISSVEITVIAGRGPISVQWAATSSVESRATRPPVAGAARHGDRGRSLPPDPAGELNGHPVRQHVTQDLLGRKRISTRIRSSRTCRGDRLPGGRGHRSVKHRQSIMWVVEQTPLLRHPLRALALGPVVGESIDGSSNSPARVAADDATVSPAGGRQTARPPPAAPADPRCPADSASAPPDPGAAVRAEPPSPTVSTAPHGRSPTYRAAVPSPAGSTGIPVTGPVSGWLRSTRVPRLS